LVVLGAAGGAFWLFRAGLLPGLGSAPSEPATASGKRAPSTPPAETPSPVPPAEATAAPELAAATTPSPTVASATATPRVPAVATASPVPSVPPPTTAPPAATAVPATATPTEVPTEAPTVAPQEAPSEPPSLKSLSPPKIRRGLTTILDVRGQGFRADQQIKLTKGREGAPGVQVTRQRVADPTLLQVVLIVDANAPTGAYSLTLVDAEGRASNPLPLEISN